MPGSRTSKRKFRNSSERHTSAQFQAVGAGQPASELMAIEFYNIEDIHLKSNSRGAIKPRGSLAMVLTFVAIAVLTLLVAATNFTNLSTARASLRAREIGIRKVAGASRRQLIIQFLGESVALSILALFAALAIVELTLPALNSFLARQLTLSYSNDYGLISAIIAIATATGVLSGLYPALMLSSYRPAAVLKSGPPERQGDSGPRAYLIIGQFAVSIALIIVTGITIAQTEYVRSFDIGIDKNNKLILRGMNDDRVREGINTFKAQLLAHPDIRFAASSSTVPGDGHDFTEAYRLPGQESEKPLLIVTQHAGPDFFEAYGARILAGRSFSEAFLSDVFRGYGETERRQGAAVMVNRSALNILGFAGPQDAIGKEIRYFIGDSEPDVSLTIVGVVDDIHYRSARDDVRPTVFLVDEPNFFSMTISYETDDLPALAAFVDKAWSDLFPDIPIRRIGFDDHQEALYASDTSASQLFAAFAGLAILISCLGLFGLAAFVAERRTKEIGVRKVLGAKVADIVKLLTWQFSKPVLLANLIAWPVAWYFMRQWLDGFAYRIDLSIFYFVAAGAGALAIAWLTVAAHAFRVARSNPVHALRYE